MYTILLARALAIGDMINYIEIELFLSETYIGSFQDRWSPVAVVSQDRFTEYYYINFVLVSTTSY